MIDLAPPIPDQIVNYNPDTQIYEFRNSAGILQAKEVPNFLGGFRGYTRYSGNWINVEPPIEWQGNNAIRVNEEFNFTKVFLKVIDSIGFAPYPISAFLINNLAISNVSLGTPFNIPVADIFFELPLLSSEGYFVPENSQIVTTMDVIVDAFIIKFE